MTWHGSLEIECTGEDTRCAEIMIDDATRATIRCVDGADCQGLYVEAYGDIELHCAGKSNCSHVRLKSRGQTTFRCEDGANCQRASVTGKSVTCEGVSC
jgi:hypothetical protein